jgi:hypothetical protein
MRYGFILHPARHSCPLWHHTGVHTTRHTLLYSDTPTLPESVLEQDGHQTEHRDGHRKLDQVASGLTRWCLGINALIVLRLILAEQRRTNVSTSRALEETARIWITLLS